MRAVLDASAVIAALDHERPEDAVAMHGLAGSHELLAPRLLPSELGHFIHRKAPARFGIDVRDRAVLLQMALDPISLRSLDGDARALAGHLAERHKLSFYDAEYLALAILTEALLVTEDKDLLAAARKEMGAQRVGDWDAIRRKRPPGGRAGAA